MSIEKNEEFRPKIVAFCCNWCSYAGADLAGSSRMSYSADVKIIRVPCSCRVNPMFILRAFERGADGVIMCGCHPGDCHYTSGNFYARRRMTLLFFPRAVILSTNSCIVWENFAPSAADTHSTRVRPFSTPM